MILTRRQLAEVRADLDFVRFWDLAATKPTRKNRDPDWTAGCLLGLNREAGDWIIVDVRRIRETPKATEDFLWRAHLLDDDLLGVEVPIRVEQEGGATGKISVDQLARHRFRGLNFQGKVVTRDKQSRATPASVAAENGLVHMVDGPWIDDFLDELEAFPDPEVHDDQVDAFSGAFNWLRPRVVTDGTEGPQTLRGDDWSSPDEPLVERTDVDDWDTWGTL